MSARIPLLLLLVACCGAPNRSSPEPTTGPAPTPSAEPVDAGAPTATLVHSAGPPVPEAGAEVTGGTVLIGEIAAPKKFNPSPTIAALVPDLLTCYGRARGSVPALRGKLNLRVVVSEVGATQSVAAEPGGGANAPTLVSCIEDALKGATFPKPGGTAIIIVPLVFRP
jgi:hypothetical protein